MLSRVENPYEKILNSTISYKFSSECKALSFVEEDIICYGY